MQLFTATKDPLFGEFEIFVLQTYLLQYAVAYSFQVMKIMLIIKV